MSTTTVNNKITGKAAENLIWCFICRASKEPLGGSYEYNDTIPNFPWAVSIKCPNPHHESWIVCSKCSFSKKRLKDKMQLVRHHRRFHQYETDTTNSKRKTNDNSLLNKEKKKHCTDIEFIKNAASKKVVLSTNLPPTTNDIHNNNNVIGTVNKNEPSEKIQFNFSNEKSNKYFQHQYKNSGGSAYLVGLSQFHFSDIGNKIRKEEIDLDISIASLCNNIQKDKRNELAKVINGVSAFVRRVTEANMKSNGASLSPYTIKLPITENDIRKRYIDGKYSINDNLPMPTIHDLERHSYISIIDIVKHMLGHGMSFDTIQSYKSLSDNKVSCIGQSMRAKEILNNSAIRFPDGNVMPLWIIEWSDDFDPNDSIKANRGSVWLKTVTICMPPRITKNQHLYTYPIAIGEKGDSHEEVEDKFLWDMAILSGNTETDNKFYSAK